MNNVHRNLLLTLTTVLAGATFAVACGDEDEVSTTGGVARAAPAYSADDAVRDALGKLDAERKFRRAVESADVLEYTANDAVRDALGTLDAERSARRAREAADVLDHVTLGNGPFEPDTLYGAK